MTDPRKIHLADQLGCDLRLIAKMLGEYRAELKTEGFTDVEILELVKHAAAVLLPSISWHTIEGTPMDGVDEP